MEPTARSEALGCDCSLARVVGSNRAGEYGCLPVVNVVSCAGRDLCDGSIPRPEKS